MSDESNAQVTQIPATRADVLRILQENLPVIRQRFGIVTLGLFGSGARDELRPDSDIDVLVEFEGPATYAGYFGLFDYLEEILGRKVDLITETGLKPRVRADVEQDLIRVA